jgi:hypothetical protein
MKSFWLACVVALAVAGAAGAGCGPKKAFCPDVLKGQECEPVRPDTGVTGAGGDNGGAGGGDGPIIITGTGGGGGSGAGGAAGSSDASTGN